VSALLVPVAFLNGLVIMRSELSAFVDRIAVSDVSMTPSRIKTELLYVAYSPELGHSIGLGFLKKGDQRKGD
jgi:hypothetical protein